MGRHIQFKAKELRQSEPTKADIQSIKKNPIYIVCDNIIDTYNIGSLFRLADAIAAKKIYLCGETEYPPNTRIHKAAVGTEKWVPWQKCASAAEEIKKLRTRGVQIIAVEQSPKSIPYSRLPPALRFPCAIVIGNETTGVSKEVLDTADVTVEIPMFGINNSLNVWGAGAIVAYKVIEVLKAQIP